MKRLLITFWHMFRVGGCLRVVINCAVSSTSDGLNGTEDYLGVITDGLDIFSWIGWRSLCELQSWSRWGCMGTNTKLTFSSKLIDYDIVLQSIKELNKNISFFYSFPISIFSPLSSPAPPKQSLNHTDNHLSKYPSSGALFSWPTKIHQSLFPNPFVPVCLPSMVIWGTSRALRSSSVHWGLQLLHRTYSMIPICTKYLKM